MKKYSLLIAFLLVFAFFEGCILLYDVFGHQPQAFALDRYEYVNDTQAEKPVEKADIQKEVGTQQENFAVNLGFAQSAHKNLDELHEDLSQSAMRFIADIPLTDDSAQNDFSMTKEPAVPLDENNTKNLPQIAIVIDDVGLSKAYTQKIADLKKPLTASMLTYGAANKAQAEILQNAGMEIMVHVPMMPHIPANLAPVTLSPEMPQEEISSSLNAMLDRYNGVAISGINNHMGSLFTERTKPMGYVMQVLQQRGLFFLDSKTTAKSVGKETAEKYKVPYLTRDVFLDNENQYDYVMGQLAQTEKVARRKGYAIAIGHPHSETIRALQDWLQTVEKRGFKLVKISQLLPQNAKK